jgi:hypothetical protein
VLVNGVFSENVFLDVAAITVEIRFRAPDVDRDLLATVHELFGGSPRSTEEPDAILEIGRGPLPPRFPGDPIEMVPRWTNSSDVLGTKDEIRRRSDGTWQLRAVGFVIEWTETTGSLHLAQHASRRDILSGVLGSVIVLGRNGNVLPLHCGVLAHEGAGTLLIGPSHSGKSSTVAIAFQTGLSVASDDIAFVRRSADGFEVRGLARSVMVPAELDPTGVGERIDRRGRRRLDVDFVADWLPLRRLIYVAHGDQDCTEVTTLPGGEGARRLISRVAATLFDSDQHRQEWIHSLIEMVALPRHHLLLGADEAKRLDSTRVALRTIFDMH